MATLLARSSERSRALESLGHSDRLTRRATVPVAGQRQKSRQQSGETIDFLLG